MSGRRCVVVTGAASGIGRAVVETVLTRWEGSIVGAIDLDWGALEELQSEFDDRLSIHGCDVADPDAVSEAVQAAASSHDLVGMVSAAGNHLIAPSLELDPASWHSVLGVHLDGTFYGVKMAAAIMIAGETGGSIVNFCSVAMDFGWPGRLPYAVAKAGVGALTRTLAVEWARHGIRVNAVAPGYVDTPMVRNAAQQGIFDADAKAKAHALGRFASPQEIANVVEFLLSDRSSFVTGEVIRVDGGFSVVK